MNPNRRQFLASATSFVGAISLPGWIPSGRIRRGSAGSSADEPRTGEEALALAKRRGRLLLVILLPDYDGLRGTRGRLFGVYVNRVEGEAAAELAMCDLWCATYEGTLALVPKVEIDRSLLAVVVEPSRRSFRPVRELPPRQNWEPFPEMDNPVATAESCTDAARATIREFSSTMHDAIAPDHLALAERVALERAALEASAEPALVTKLVEAAEPAAEFAKVAPASFLARARRARPEDQPVWWKLAEGEVAARWRKAPPPRMRWATAGCGTRIEHLPSDAEQDSGGHYCGMAATPEYSRRFLVFYLEQHR
jgi:hypothetical protein